MAIDIKVEGISATDVQQAIKDNYHSYFKGIGLTAIEDNTPTWTHLACENYNIEDLVIIPFFKKK